MMNILGKIDRFNADEYSLEIGQPFTIRLTTLKRETSIQAVSDRLEQGKEYMITVKKYMTEPATVTFDFQDKWNDGKPMPMVTMQGEVLQETRGMYKMHLKAVKRIGQVTERCYNCGKQLTHPVSRLYGIGPECGRHFYINPFNTVEELQEHLAELNDRLDAVEWTGWVIKSAIKEWEEI